MYALGSSRFIVLNVLELAEKIIRSWPEFIEGPQERPAVSASKMDFDGMEAIPFDDLVVDRIQDSLPLVHHCHRR